MRVVFISLLFSGLFGACGTGQSDKSEQSKKEIAAAEKAFNDMASQKGIAAAFHFYADSAAVIKRDNDSLIRGKEGILNYYSDPRFAKASVSWSPDHVEASAAGDLGYTYGHYTWRSADSSGKTTEYKGIFQTIWKKQKDGSWKYVWD